MSLHFVFVYWFGCIHRNKKNQLNKIFASCGPNINYICLCIFFHVFSNDLYQLDRIFFSYECIFFSVFSLFLLITITTPLKIGTCSCLIRNSQCKFENMNTKNQTNNYLLLTTTPCALFECLNFECTFPNGHRMPIWVCVWLFSIRLKY